MKKILITGGAGFIGSNVIRHFVNKYPDYLIYNLDSLSHAGNLKNLTDIENKKNYSFIYGDISNDIFVNKIFYKYQFDSVINLAAESHVDRSINNPILFAHTNIIGTLVLLNAFKKLWGNDWNDKLFYHISTDEVYGSLTEKGSFSENTSYKPNSPYSASKASSDHFVRAYSETFGIPHIISNCSNNYGPNQFPDKLVPLAINNIIKKKIIPIYGKGENIRDWLYVIDHVNAIDLIFHRGIEGETYNIGSQNEWKNIDLIRLICKLMDVKLGRPIGSSLKLINYVKDRPGHDYRYAIDNSKIKRELGWSSKYTFEEGLNNTIDWYLDNQEWLESIDSGNYKNYNNKQAHL